MKTYPTISKVYRWDIPLHIFSKLDGSNIRCEWSPKQGFYKFGSRHQLIDKDSQFNQAIDLIKSKYEDDLSEIFLRLKYKSAVAFFEYFGPNSFAGQHDFKSMDVVLFDVNPFNIGIISPEEFVDNYGHLHIPNILHKGYLTEEIVKMIKSSTLPGMPEEGVVAKGVDGGKLVMFKIKSNAWLDRLRVQCGDDDRLFEKLS